MRGISPSFSGCFREASPGCLSRVHFLFAAADSVPSVLSKAPLRICNKVLAVLAELSTDVQQEFATQEGHSIDARMLWEGKYVAVEVDGPSHFLAGCGGRAPARATMLQHRELSAFGWQLVVVPHFEQGELKSVTEW